MSGLQGKARALFRIDRPLAITMWDFSWIERRWPGAGFENWDSALAELCERGYDAVRVDAFPHLLAEDPAREWTLLPVWNTQAWGSPLVNRVCLKDDLRDFLKVCRQHGVRVALSSWFREDTDRIRDRIDTPEKLAEIWIRTLRLIEDWGELENLLYVDLCNEFPLPVWAPFCQFLEDIQRTSPEVRRWMRPSIAGVKAAFPGVPLTFSFTHPYPDFREDVSCLDFLEAHCWMASCGEYYDRVGYHYERFSDEGYRNVALRGKAEYLAHRERYLGELRDTIHGLADWAVYSGKPLITTECWALVDYKDGPLLDWDWILDLNREGVQAAAETGAWAAMATSNFCAPQFVGMWREKDWHQRLTGRIHDSRHS